jgi:hypothetical protein
MTKSLNNYKDMKTLYESILTDIEDTLNDGNHLANELLKKSVHCLDISYDKNNIILSYDKTNQNTNLPFDSSTPAIIKDINCNGKIIIKNDEPNFSFLEIRSGVSANTIKKIQSKKPLDISFVDEWAHAAYSKDNKQTELKNCTIIADTVYFCYPVTFKNCTIKLIGKYCNFKSNNCLKDIKELKGLKVEPVDLNKIEIDISSTQLGTEIRRNNDNDTYMQKLDKVLESVFSALIKKGRSCKLRYETYWSREYSPSLKIWTNSYGY